MNPDPDFLENGLLIITGSNLHAEQADRPLAYQLKQTIGDMYKDNGLDIQVVVMSDIWYLNGEALHRLPMISIGCTEDNAVSSFLAKDMPSALVVDDVLMIQMDMLLEDLRASIWGANHQSTVDALEIFTKRGYLKRFLNAVTARQY